jgi:hypothetical protein
VTYTRAVDFASKAARERIEPLLIDATYSDDESLIDSLDAPDLDRITMRVEGYRATTVADKAELLGNFSFVIGDGRGEMFVIRGMWHKLNKKGEPGIRFPQQKLDTNYWEPFASFYTADAWATLYPRLVGLVSEAAKSGGASRFMPEVDPADLERPLNAMTRKARDAAKSRKLPNLPPPDLDGDIPF